MRPTRAGMAAGGALILVAALGSTVGIAAAMSPGGPPRWQSGPGYQYYGSTTGPGWRMGSGGMMGPGQGMTGTFVVSPR